MAEATGIENALLKQWEEDGVAGSFEDVQGVLQACRGNGKLLYIYSHCLFNLKHIYTLARYLALHQRFDRAGHRTYNIHVQTFGSPRIGYGVERSRANIRP